MECSDSGCPTGVRNAASDEMFMRMVIHLLNFTDSVSDPLTD